MTKNEIKIFNDLLFTEMTFVEGGSFMMGASSNDTNVWGRELPQHQVVLDSFYIGKYEVTQAFWTKIVGNNPSYFKLGDYYPVENLSWEDCYLFISKLNEVTGIYFRLPTEAEWEYAARGGAKESERLNKLDLDKIAWYDANSENKTHPVGLKLANELELYDVCGNVWEWCSDYYGESYYASSPITNPKGPNTGILKVIRGGCWGTGARSCRLSYRYRGTPNIKSNMCGIRLAFTLK